MFEKGFSASFAPRAFSCKKPIFLVLPSVSDTMLKNCYFIVLTFTSLSFFAQNTEIKGTVFDDSNGNTVQDANEKGIGNVVVSDQKLTAVTDANGSFVLNSASDFPYLFISQPDGFKGTYYYPKASEMDFPLQKTKDQQTFRFIHASDTHVDSLNLPRIKRFREMTDSLDVDFVVISGDLIRDALRVNESIASNYYKMYVLEIKKFKLPVYSGVGNHELFGIERDKSKVSKEHPLYGKKMFRKYLGPNYYSFNYGGMHFISLDGVGYQDQYYFGGVDSLQLDWLRNDLANLSKETPIVTFNHIPFVSAGFTFQNFETHEFYGPSLLEQNGKLEHRHIVHNYNAVKNIFANRSYPLALAGHYHAAQESSIVGAETRFIQTSAITRPDQFDYNGFKVRSGFTLYELKDAKIVSSKFIPLNFPE